MKRLLSIFFLSFYILFSYGFMISAHYCGGKMVSLEFMKKAKSCCGDDESKNSCCSTDNTVIFLDDNQLDTKSVALSTPIFDLDISHLTLLGNRLSTIDVDPIAYFDDLPPPDEEKVFLENCSLVFYG